MRLLVPALTLAAFYACVVIWARRWCKHEIDRRRLPLVDAVRQGNVDHIVALLSGGADPNAFERSYIWRVGFVPPWLPFGILEVAGNETSALMLAARSGNMAAARELIMKGADPNRGSMYQGPPLLNAVAAAKYEMVVYLIQSGADPNRASSTGDVPLIDAACEDNTDIVRALILAGAAVDAKDGEGMTALMSAAMEGQVENVKLLLEAGANAALRTDGGLQALDFAERHGFPTVIQVLRDAESGI